MEDRTESGRPSGNIVRPLTHADRTALAEFLTHGDRLEGTMSIGEVEGFFFAVAASPEAVRPSEWYEIVFGGELPQFASSRESERVTGALLSLYNLVQDDVREHGGKLPAVVEFRTDPRANLEPDSPLSHWSRGFVEGHLWLQDVWAPFEEELADEFLEVLWTLGFFATGPIAEEMWKGADNPEITLNAVVEEACGSFVRAASVYANLGLYLQNLVRDRRRRTPDAGDFIRPGRNDPCSCGSLKQYAKCCGRIARA